MKRIFIDMDYTLVDFTSGFHRARERNPGQPWPQSQYGFFANLEPLPDAVWAWKRLQELGHVTYILTAPSILNPMCYAEKRVSVEKIFGFEACHNLIICEDKSLLHGDVLIDDKTDSHKQDLFRGTFIHFGSQKFPDWRTTVGYVETELADDKRR